MTALGVQELEGLLDSLQQLKAPGASGKKIALITQMCKDKVQEEEDIVRQLYQSFKKSQATHKLGVMFVIDSVVRQWIKDGASDGLGITGKEMIENTEGRGVTGRRATGVKRIYELMPLFMDEILKDIPEDQKPKLEKLISIWEESNTFTPGRLAEIKAKLNAATTQSVPKAAPAPVPAIATPDPRRRAAAPARNSVLSTHSTGLAAQQHSVNPRGAMFQPPIPTRPITPVGWPPAYLWDQGLVVSNLKRTNAQANTHSVPAVGPAPLQAVQQAPAVSQAHATQNTALQHQPAAPVIPPDLNAILAGLASAAPAPAQQYAPPQSIAPQAPPPKQQLPPLDVAALIAAAQAQARPAPPPPQPAAYQAYNLQAYQLNNAAQPPSAPPPQYYAPPPQQQVAPPPQQMQLTVREQLGSLANILPQHVLEDPQKLDRTIKLLLELTEQGIPQNQWGPVIDALNPKPEPLAQYGAYEPQPDRYDIGGRGRARSRSPQRVMRGGRESPVYGTYEEIAAREREQGERGGNNQQFRGRYRQRSPARAPISAPSGSYKINGNGQPKYIAYDNTLPQGHIKVLSRTLFVGGANGTEEEIRHLFERFGVVQTCIVNLERRHAFVKMTTRMYSLAAKTGLERLQTQKDRETLAIARQTKWGVGFGPRESCNYQKGESIVPIDKLTDADHKWLLTAEYGGTGGRPLEPGMVLEEPDIEIGAGVSSKAMSKRVQADNGPPPAKRQEKFEKAGGKHRNDRRADRHRERDRDHDGTVSSYSGINRFNSPRLAAEPVQVATPLAVPNFGFGIQMPPQGQYR